MNAHIRLRLLSAIFWSPATWLPFSLATFGALVVNLPWWANCLTYACAIGLTTAFWLPLIPKLADLWAIEYREQLVLERHRSEDNLAAECDTLGFQLGARTLKRAYAIEREIHQYYTETDWLNQFSYESDVTALVDHLENAVKEALSKLQAASGRSITIRQLDENHRQNFSDGVSALEDTLAVCKRTLAETAIGDRYNSSNRAGMSARDLIERNKAARQALDRLPPGNTVEQ